LKLHVYLDITARHDKKRKGTQREHEALWDSRRAVSEG